MVDNTKIPGGVVITRNDIERHKREILDQCMLVNIEDAATILSCSKSTVYRKISEGKIGAYNDTGAFTRGTKLLASELRDYVKSSRLTLDDLRK